MSSNDNVQRNIQGQNRVAGSLYINHMKSIYNITNMNNEGAKHGSYERRLQKLRGNVIAATSVQKHAAKNISTPTQGNKKVDYNITSKHKVFSANYRNIDYNSFLHYFPNINLGTFVSYYNNAPFNVYLQKYDNNSVYDVFEQIESRPKTLTLTTNGQGEEVYEFSGFKDDLSVNTNLPEISYNTYNDGVSGNFTSTVISKTDVEKMSIILDFEILTDASTLDNDRIYTILDMGKKFAGLSIVIYIDTNGNKELHVLHGAGNSDNEEKGNLIYKQTITNSFINQRNLITLTYERTGKLYNEINAKIYINSSNVYSRNTLGNSTGSSIFIAGGNGVGFGTIHSSGSDNNVAINKDILDISPNIITNSLTNILKIKGRFFVFDNSYDECIRSNYFTSIM